MDPGIPKEMVLFGLDPVDPSLKPIRDTRAGGFRHN